ncbi:MAG: hypothetical protein KAH20_06075 [Methylococcales bacterium]|nr:hypothetical protein [Methylococcales bacterium]
MLKKFIRPALVTAVMFNLPLGSFPVANAAPNPDDVPGLSTLKSSFQDFAQVSDYAKKAVVRLELLGLLNDQRYFQPQQTADKTFAKELLGTLNDLGSGDMTYAEAKQLITEYLINTDMNVILSFDGFLSKKGYQGHDNMTREDFAYLVAHAREANIIDKGLPIHNPAIATPGPLLGPTVFQSGEDGNGAVFDGSTVSLFHRAKNTFNTTFNDSPVYTLQVHPEVFKSVSVGGIAVDALQDLSAQLEVELTDGTIHRTPLTSMIPFSIHGADGKAGVIRIEDGLLVFADDLLGHVDSFTLNGHEFTVKETIDRVNAQTYYNGDKNSEEVIAVVVNELESKNFSLQDRRLMTHNLILTKTALQQIGLSPLSSPFNTIAGPSSGSRSFKDGHLFKTYQVVDDLRNMAKAGNESAIRDALNNSDVQQNLLTGTKILTAVTLLPHITELSNAPFLPNEALSSRVKKSGALLASEPISFQLDRLKRAAYILLDDALSVGKAAHLVTFGEIIKREDAESVAFSLSAGNFDAVLLQTKKTVLIDAIHDYSQAYEELVRLISGVEFDGSLNKLNDEHIASISTAFSHPILSSQMADIKIGGLDFKLDMLATPSHVLKNLSPANDLTQSRQTEGFDLGSSLDPFPIRLAEYICTGNVVTDTGGLISKSKLNPLEQGDLISDFSFSQNEDCRSAVDSPRYHQLLFVDNFELPPFGPRAKFISTQGIEIINRLLLTPVEANLPIADIRLSYRLTEAKLNQAPEAQIKGRKKGRVGKFMKLNAKHSNDADGDSLKYQWKVKSGKAIIFQSRSRSKATVLPLSKGNLVIELQVNDGTANSKVVEKTIKIRKKRSFNKHNFFQKLFSWGHFD